MVQENTLILMNLYMEAVLELVIQQKKIYNNNKIVFFKTYQLIITNLRTINHFEIRKNKFLHFNHKLQITSAKAKAKIIVIYLNFLKIIL